MCHQCWNSLRGTCCIQLFPGNVLLYLGCPKAPPESKGMSPGALSHIVLHLSVMAKLFPDACLLCPASLHLQRHVAVPAAFPTALLPHRIAQHYLSPPAPICVPPSTATGTLVSGAWQHHLFSALNPYSLQLVYYERQRGARNEEG